MEILCRQDEGESTELDDVDVNTQSKKSLVKMVNKLWNQDQIAKLEERGLSSKADQKRARPALAHRMVVMEGLPPPCTLPLPAPPSRNVASSIWRVDGVCVATVLTRGPVCLGRAGAQGQRADERRAHLPAQQAPARRAQKGNPPDPALSPIGFLHARALLS